MPLEIEFPAHPHSVFDEDEFSKLLLESLSLNIKEKGRILNSIPRLPQEGIDSLVKILKAERKKFKKLKKEGSGKVEALKRIRNQELEEFVAKEGEILRADEQPADVERHPLNAESEKENPIEMPIKIEFPLHPLSNFDEDEFSTLLLESLSLELEVKRKVLNSIPRLSQDEIDSLLKILRNEKVSFEDLRKNDPEGVQALLATRMQELENYASERGEILRAEGQYVNVELPPLDIEAGKRYPIPPHPLTMFDDTYFAALLAGSLSLDEEQKLRVLTAIPRLGQAQIDELVKIFEEERFGFAVLEVDHRDEVEKFKKDAIDKQKESYRNDVLDFLNPLNEIVIRRLSEDPTRIREMSSRKFEILMAELFTDEGWEVTLLPATRDGGRDLIMTRDLSGRPILSIVECKRFQKKNVGIEVVERFMYTLRDKDRANLGIIAATTGFSKGAIGLANDYSWQLELRDYDIIKEMLSSFGQDRRLGNLGVWRPE